MKNLSKVVKIQLIDNLFVFVTSHLYKFAFLSQTSSIEKTKIKILYCYFSHLYFHNIIKLILLFSDIEILKSMNKFCCKTRIFAE